MASAEAGPDKPSLNSLKKIADALGVTAGALLDESGPPDKDYPLGKRFSDLMAGYPAREQRAFYDPGHSLDALAPGATFKTLAQKIKKISKR